MKASLGKDATGSLTVEAAFVLSFFVIAMVSWTLLLFVLQIQSMTQHALDQACLSLADKISLTHTLSAKESGIRSFVKAMGAKTLSIPLPSLLREVAGTKALETDLSREFQAFFGRGDGYATAMHPPSFSIRVADEADLLEADVSYRLDLPGLLKPLGPIPVHQHTTSGLWLLTDDPVFGSNTEKEKKEKGEESIWQKPPLTRGRILVDRMRKKSGAQQLQRGQIVDLRYADGTAEAILSLNLFSATYASGNGNAPEHYQLKEEGLFRALASQASRLKKAVHERQMWTDETGSSFSWQPKQCRLRVILPLEAQHFSGQLQAMAEKIRYTEGVELVWAFEEKALVPQNETGGQHAGSSENH